MRDDPTENRQSEPQTWTIEAPIAWLLVALVLGLVAANIVLLRQNHSLKQTLRVRTEPAYAMPGQEISRLRGIDTNGQPLVFRTSEVQKKTVLLVFQPKCQWCGKNMENWNALIANADRERFRFLAISTNPEGLTDYLAAYPRLASVPVMADPEPDDQLRYRLFDTPQTLVIDRRGVVEKIWVGSIDGRLRREVEDYFDIPLPGPESTGDLL